VTAFASATLPLLYQPATVGGDYGIRSSKNVLGPDHSNRAASNRFGQYLQANICSTPLGMTDTGILDFPRQERHAYAKPFCRPDPDTGKPQVRQSRKLTPAAEISNAARAAARRPGAGLFALCVMLMTRGGSRARPASRPRTNPSLMLADPARPQTSKKSVGQRRPETRRRFGFPVLGLAVVATTPGVVRSDGRGRASSPGPGAQRPPTGGSDPKENSRWCISRRRPAESRWHYSARRSTRWCIIRSSSSARNIGNPPFLVSCAVNHCLNDCSNSLRFPGNVHPACEIFNPRLNQGGNSKLEFLLRIGSTWGRDRHRGRPSRIASAEDRRDSARRFIIHGYGRACPRVPAEHHRGWPRSAWSIIATRQGGGRQQKPHAIASTEGRHRMAPRGAIFSFFAKTSRSKRIFLFPLPLVGRGWPPPTDEATGEGDPFYLRNRNQPPQSGCATFVRRPNPWLPTRGRRARRPPF